MKHALLLLVCLFGLLSTAPAIVASKVLQPGRYSGLIVVTVTDPSYKVKQSISARFTTRLRADGTFAGYYLVNSGPPIEVSESLGDGRAISASQANGALFLIQNSESAMFVDATFDLSNTSNFIEWTGHFDELSNGRRSKCKLTSKAISFEDSANFATSDPALPGTYSISVKLTRVGD